MDGFETLAAIRRAHLRVPVIIYSQLSAPGAAATFRALAEGATAFALKPSVAGIGEAEEQVRGELVPLIRALFPRGRGGGVCLRPDPTPTSRRPQVIAIAASTGGPTALSALLGALPADWPIPILVVQHMPALFTGPFADRLHDQTRLEVVEAREGQHVVGGTVYVAPGDRHLEVVVRGRRVVTRLHGGPKENGCRPAADVLFRSVAQAYGPGAVAVVLTGMGCDGLLGASAIGGLGGFVIAESEETAVVSSMPAAVAAAGIANQVLPLDRIGSTLLRRVHSGGPS